MPSGQCCELLKDGTMAACEHGRQNQDKEGHSAGQCLKVRAATPLPNKRFGSIDNELQLADGYRPCPPIGIWASTMRTHCALELDHGRERRGQRVRMASRTPTPSKPQPWVIGTTWLGTKKPPGPTRLKSGIIHLVSCGSDHLSGHLGADLPRCADVESEDPCARTAVTSRGRPTRAPAPRASIIAIRLCSK